MLKKLAHSAIHRMIAKVRRARHRRTVHRIIAAARPRRGRVSESARQVAADIGRDGFVYVTEHFDREKLVRLRRGLEGLLCYDQWHLEKGRFRLEDIPPDTNNARIVGTETLPEAVEIANDPVLIEIAAAYLGCRPHVDEPLAWWSVPREQAIQEQFFHRDNPSSRWIKLFIYLSDVGETEGPHTFVKASHRTDECLAEGTRFTDDQVIDACGADRLIRFTGPFGTAILEDTYGLHKGEVPTIGTRLIFEITYSTYALAPAIKNPPPRPETLPLAQPLAA